MRGRIWLDPRSGFEKSVETLFIVTALFSEIHANG
jgi:hypothetical protein